MQIVPFHPGLIEQAGQLLAQRHRLNRALTPLLPSYFEDAQAACGAVEELWKRDLSSGAAVMQGDRLVGYMIGHLVLEAIWGRSAWVRLAGCALAPDADPELLRDLYATLGAQWIAQGCFAHFALVPTADVSAVQSWFSLSFGIEHIHALEVFDEIEIPAPVVPPGVEIRRAVDSAADRSALADLSNIIWQHQTQAPTWGIALPEKAASTRSDWSEVLDEPGAQIWLAFQDGIPIGSQGYFPAETFDDPMLIPEQCAYMTLATVREPLRGRGIGLALTRYGMAYAKESGYRHCLTNWRSTNLLASRFWPRQGFRPVAYRLVRRIDPQIAWARGNP